MPTKPIPPKTAGKLSEAESCLYKMLRTRENTEEFRRYVSGFLAAARSIKDVLRSEIATGNRQAKDEIEGRMNADAEMQTLVDLRDADQHEGILSLNIEWLEDDYVPRGPADEGLQYFYRRQGFRRHNEQSQNPLRSRVIGPVRAKEMIARAFLPGITDRDAYTVCEQHLGKVRTAIIECVKKYG